ncbi:MAG: hypothetical protein ACJ762_05980 [Solirubrobacteraceae bacterium]
MSPRHVAAAGLLALVCAAPAAASSAHCSVPLTNGFSWSSLHETGIGCEAARTLAQHYQRNGHLEHWTCSHRVSGRSVSFSCRHTLQTHQTVAGSWHVH